jgi:hypothetical protein
VYQNLCFLSVDNSLLIMVTFTYGHPAWCLSSARKRPYWVKRSMGRHQGHEEPLTVNIGTIHDASDTHKLKDGCKTASKRLPSSNLTLVHCRPPVCEVPLTVGELVDWANAKVGKERRRKGDIRMLREEAFRRSETFLILYYWQSIALYPRIGNHAWRPDFRSCRSRDKQSTTQQGQMRSSKMQGVLTHLAQAVSNTGQDVSGV